MHILAEFHVNILKNTSENARQADQCNFLGIQEQAANQASVRRPETPKIELSNWNRGHVVCQKCQSCLP